ncbi:MAG: hypothetical protein ACE5FI_16240, partial [Anaerolineales bacterium]
RLADSDLADVIFTRMGRRVRLLYKNIVATEDGALDFSRFENIIKEADGDPAKLAESFAGLMEQTAKKMFPTALERAALGEEIGGRTLALAKIDDWLQNRAVLGKGVRDLNQIFANLYMGYSPAYAIRNMLSNTTHIAIDHGYYAAASSLIDIGRAGIRGLFGEEAITKHLDDEMLRVVGSTETLSAWQRALGGPAAAIADTTRALFSRVSANMENVAGKRIMLLTARRAMKKALRANLPESARIAEIAGIPLDSAKALRHAMIDNYANFDELRDILTAARSRGETLQAWRHLGTFTPDETRALLEEHGMWDQMVRKAGEMSAAGFQQWTRQQMPAILGEMKAWAWGRPASLDLPREEAMALGLRLDGLEDARDGENIAEWAARKGASRLTDEEQEAYNWMIGQNEAARETAMGALNDVYRSFQSSDVANDVAVRERFANALQGLHQKAAQLRVTTRETATRLRDDLMLAFRQGKLTRTERDDLYARFVIKRDRAWTDYRRAVANPALEIHDDIARAIYGDGFDVLSLEGRAQAAEYGEISDFISNLLQKNPEDLVGAVRNGRIEYLGNLFGVATATEEGVPTPELLRIINKFADADSPFGSLADVDTDVAYRALVRWLESKGDDLANLPRMPNPTMHGTPLPWQPNAATADKVLDAMRSVADLASEQADHLLDLRGLDEAAFERLLSDAERVRTTARVQAVSEAEEARNFTLLNYGDRRNWQSVMAYGFPYGFWYYGTWRNWLTRVATNPRLAANYARYEQFLEKQHAGLPDWWKYNLNTNDLPGVNMEHPLFFNLEATINPLNGLLGVDFNDRDRRATWWSALVDDMNRFGPTVWTPITLAVAGALLVNDEKDAAAAFAGRLIPQTAG